MPTRKSIDEVIEIFDEAGLILVSDKYTNNKQKLSYRCPRHTEEVQTIRLNDVVSGHGCRICADEGRIERLNMYNQERIKPIEEVDKAFKERGYSLLKDSYKSSRYPVEYICNIHNNQIQHMKYNDLLRGQKCKYCSIENMKLTFEEVRHLFEEKGYDLLEENYVNSRTPMRYRCLIHNDEVSAITVSDLRGGHGCYQCGIEKISGKNNYRYNHNKTSDDRANDRRYDEKNHKWRNYVFKRDKYTCVACSSNKSGTLVAHHLDGYNWCTEKRYDIENGVTLCESCHKDFHGKYGYGNNTEQQFVEWRQEKEAQL